MKNKIAKVVVNSKAYSTDRFFDYKVPDGIEITEGMRVTVPFGGRILDGVVVSVGDFSEFENLKEISSVSSKKPFCDNKAIELAIWMRNRWFSRYYDALRLLMPPGCNIKFSEQVKKTASDEELLQKTRNSSVQTAISEFLISNGGVSTVSELNRELGKSVRTAINSMLKKGVITITKKQFTRGGAKTVNVAFISAEFDVLDAYMAEFGKRAPVQMRILELLMTEVEMEVPELLDSADAGKGSLDILVSKGIVEIYKKAQSRIEEEYVERDVQPTLTDEQVKVLNSLKGQTGRHILRGVTGSGKTEVYLSLIGNTIESGKTAIMLVPEISLTPQTIKRFRKRFGDNVAVLHSGLSLGERFDNWEKIRNGEVSVVVGARSAIFAPLSNIGIIIIDEQHDSSYVSEVNPRYDAREVARFRANQYGALLLEASATPRVSDVYVCKNRHSMSKRFNDAPLPTVEIVDMRAELEDGNTSVFSRKLTEEISKNIENGEQTILFINRRGHSSFVSCRSCGLVFSCPNCSISLKYHSNNNRLMCHYCGYMTAVPKTCPSCESKYVKFFGAGTQKVEEEIAKIFPSASVIRMDIDTTAKKSAHKRLLEKFVSEKTDILLGTQMVTKGLDFPNVTLVGVLAADTMINADSFEAAETAFDQLTQVCGRAGRGDIPGRAVIQTYSPDNECIHLASDQDYNEFYKQEIGIRRGMVYPPFCKIFTVLVTGEDNTAVAKRINEIKDSIKGADGIISIMRPVPCAVSRINNVYRWQMLIKASGDIREDLWRVYDEHHAKKRDTYISIY